MFDRILVRAHELEAAPASQSDHHRSSYDASATQLELEAIAAAAREVGISEDAINTSLAEEALGQPEPGKLFDRVAGPGYVTVDKVVSTSAADALTLVDDWLTSGHHLRPGRRTDTEASWSRRTDVAAKLKKKIRSVSGDAQLGNAQIIVARVAEVGGEVPTTIVRLVVDRRSTRSTRLGVGGSLGGAGITGTAVTLAGVYLAPIATVGFIAVAVGGGAVALSGRRQTVKLEAEVERLLEDVAAGQRPKGVAAGLASDIMGRVRSRR